MVVMTTGIDLSQELFAVNMLRTLKSSLKHCRPRGVLPYQEVGGLGPKIGESENKYQNEAKGAFNGRGHLMKTR